MFAHSSSLGEETELAEGGGANDVDVDVDNLASTANLLNRSEILFSWDRLGRIMLTSGSRQRGSCRPATADSGSTLTGISWVIIVSRSRGPIPPESTVVRPAGSVSDARCCALSGPAINPSGFLLCVHEDDTIVKARRGILPFLVRRRSALDAPVADLSARFSAPMGTSRLIISS